MGEQGYKGDIARKNNNIQELEHVEKQHIMEGEQSSTLVVRDNLQDKGRHDVTTIRQISTATQRDNVEECKALVLYEQTRKTNHVDLKEPEVLGVIENVVDNYDMQEEDQVHDGISSRHIRSTKFNYGVEGQNSVVVYDVPIKQSSLIRDLDKLVSHQVEQTNEVMDIILLQQPDDELYENKEEIDNHNNLEHALKEAGDFIHSC